MAALEVPAARLGQLLHEAALLDRRARQMARDEERLVAARRDLDREAESVAVQQAEVQEREEQLERREAQLRLASSALDDERARLEAESARIAHAEDELAMRERRFDNRWRWLVGCLSLVRIRRRSEVRPCDVLLVPTQDGYRLLGQSGLAVAPGAVLRGLVDTHRTFEVTRIAPVPFENRICAYLQETTMEGGGT
jgi:septal ring factor EnvC (AmiA/AmiB activator)